MQSTVLAVIDSVCLSVCLSICHSPVSCQITQATIMRSSLEDSLIVSSQLMSARNSKVDREGALNERRIGKIHNF